MARLISEADHEKLSRLVRQQGRELTNLKQRLATVSVRRHEGRSTPLARIRFRNDSGVAVAAWGVMRITGGSEQDYLTVDSVDSTYRWLYLVNGPRPVAAEADSYGFGSYLTTEPFSRKRGRVLVSGTPAYGEEYGPVSGSQALGQHRPGFFILGGYNSTKGTVMAIQLPPAEVLVFNAGSSVAAAATGTATLHGGAAGSEATLGLTISAFNRTSTAWGASKYGAVGRLNGKAYVVPFQT